MKLLFLWSVRLAYSCLIFFFTSLLPSPSTADQTPLSNASAWQPLNATHLPASVTALIRFNDNLYAGTDGNGIFRLDSAVQRWVPVPISGHPKAEVRSFAIFNRTLFAGLIANGVVALRTDKTSFHSANEGLILRSAPPEADPQEADAGCGLSQSHYFADVTTLLSTPEALYAITSKGLYRRTPASRWNAIQLTMGGIEDIAYLNGYLYIGRDGCADQCGIFRLPAGGGVLMRAVTDCIAITSMINDDNRVFAVDSDEIWIKSKDRAWTSLAFPNRNERTTYVRLALCQDTLVAIESGGETWWYSASGWSGSGQGFPAESDEIHAIFSDGETLYAGTKSGQVLQAICKNTAK